MQRPTTLRLLLTFAAGIAVAAALGWPGGVGSFAATRYEDLSLFTEVLSLVRKNYVEEVGEKELIQGAVKGMLQELDPHSSYLDPEVYKEMQIDTRGEFAGLGIEIAKRRDGYVEVVSPIDGTPAHRAGVKARDQIVAICPAEKPADWEEECRGTKNMSLVEAVRLMPTRTDKIPNTSATAASSGSDLNGAAVEIACTQLRERLASVAAIKLGVPAADLEFLDGRVRPFWQRDRADAGLSFAELTEQAYLQRVPLFATGYYRTPNIHYDEQAGRGSNQRDADAARQELCAAHRRAH